MFVFNNELYVYGGWNTIAAFSTAIKYNFESNELTSANIKLENFSFYNFFGILV